MTKMKNYYRVSQDSDIKNYGKYRVNVVGQEEWEGNDDRVDETAWITRYEHERDIIYDICNTFQYKKILELGPGPGILGQMISKKDSSIDYTYIDKKGAKNQFDQRGHTGKFVVKDLMNYFDTSDLDSDFDLVIANDFLEHIANPSDVMYKAWSMTKEKSGFFISVPNWRMGHNFIYRGLFDFDNFLYFCDVHGWLPKIISDSPLRCSYSPKLSSERLLDDRIVDSWNWYIYCEKISE